VLLARFVAIGAVSAPCSLRRIMYGAGIVLLMDGGGLIFRQRCEQHPRRGLEAFPPATARSRSGRVKSSQRVASNNLNRDGGIKEER
jgi:hypothetical protein